MNPIFCCCSFFSDWSSLTLSNLIIAVITGVVSGILANRIYTRNQNKQRKERLDRKLSNMNGVWIKTITKLGTDQGVKVWINHETGTSQFNGHTWYHFKPDIDISRHEYENSEYGKVNFKIWFDETSLETGTGVFQYIEPFHDGKVEDKGTYKIQMDLNNSRRLIVYYENTVPDNTVKGYEEWEWYARQ